VKLLIVDDERLICLGLTKLLEHIDHPAITGIRTTTYPREVVAIVEEFSPDAIITDIRMPGINGLELMEKVFKTHPGVKFAVLSGYSDFPLVQKALRLGAVDYLLKPATRDELKTVIDRIQEIMSREGSGHDPWAAGGEETTIMEASLHSVLFDDRLDPGSRRQMTALIKQRLPYSRVSLMLVDCLRRDFRDELIKRLPGRNQQGGIVWYGFAFRETTALLLVNSDADKDAALLASALRHQCQELPTGEAEEIVAGVSTTASGVEFLGMLYEQAQTALDQKILGRRGIILYTALQPVEPDRAVNMDRRTELSDACRDGQVGSLLGGISTWLDEAAAEGGRRLRATYEAIRSILDEEVARRNAVGCNTGRSFESFYDVPTLEKHLEGVVACLYGPSRASDHDGWLIRRTKDYILANYGKGLSLEEIADQLDISYAYLSTLFKKATGETYTSYLTRIRMQKAAELIDNTGITVGELAGKLGYASAKHFSRTFRRYFGVSPKQFQAGRSV
jgi:two-component system response regulator YesN